MLNRRVAHSFIQEARLASAERTSLHMSLANSPSEHPPQCGDTKLPHTNAFSKGNYNLIVALNVWHFLIRALD